MSVGFASAGFAVAQTTDTAEVVATDAVDPDVEAADTGTDETVVSPELGGVTPVGDASASPTTASETASALAGSSANLSSANFLAVIPAAFWKVINSLGLLFFRGPFSSDLFGVQTYAPISEDPRFVDQPQVVVPATIDLDGKLPEPAWWSWDMDYKKYNPKYISAFSNAMGRDIPLIYIPAPDQSTPRPVIYALSGRDGGEDGITLATNTELAKMAHDLNLNVVSPAEGANSNYVDWYDDSAVARGKQQWETFMTKELPIALEDAIGASHQRSLLGMSASGGPVIGYAEHNPGLYDAVGSISGCVEVDSDLGRYAQGQTLYGLGSVDEAYGPQHGDYSIYSDALINVPLLAGQQNIFVFNAGGLLGPTDFMDQYRPTTEGDWLARIKDGAFIEWGTNYFTHKLQARMLMEGIPADFQYASSGAHAWGVFNEGTVAFMNMIGERVYPKQ